MMDPNMNRTSNSTCVNFEIRPISHFLMAIYIITFVLGFLFNCLTAWPIVQEIRNRNALGVYLLSLSISDLLYIFTMPMWISYYQQNHKWTFGQSLCQLSGFFYYSNMYTGIYLLCCISIDRCLVVSFPLMTKAFHRFRYACIVCGLVYILIMSFHILVLCSGQQTHMNHQRCYETYPMTHNIAFFNFLRVAIGFVLPLLILTFCYCQILSKVQKSSGVDERGKRKVKLVSVGVLAIFSICFAPYHILLLLRTIAFNRMDTGHYCNFEQAIQVYFSCTLGLSSINSAIDPLLYVLVSHKIRENMQCCRVKFWYTMST